MPFTSGDEAVTHKPDCLEYKTSCKTYFMSGKINELKNQKKIIIINYKNEMQFSRRILLGDSSLDCRMWY